MFQYKSVYLRTNIYLGVKMLKNTYCIISLFFQAVLNFKRPVFLLYKGRIQVALIVMSTIRYISKTFYSLSVFLDLPTSYLR